MLFPILLSPVLVAGATIILVTLALVAIFYVMYHTFHGDLPKMMKGVIAAFLLIGALLIVTGVIF
jgi:hypothetical protein